PVMLTWLPRLASPSYSLLTRAPRTASSWRASKVPALQISGTKWLIVILTSTRGPPARERAVRSSDLTHQPVQPAFPARLVDLRRRHLPNVFTGQLRLRRGPPPPAVKRPGHRPTHQVRFLLSKLDQSVPRSEEHTSELQSRENLVCRLLLE